MSEEKDQLIRLFVSIGLEQKVAQDLSASAAASTVKDVVTEAGLLEGCEKSVGALLYMLATKLAPNAANHRAFLSKYIAEKKLKMVPQLEAALVFCKKYAGKSFEIAEFDEACGVGVVVTEEQIKAEVGRVLDDHAEELKEKRYRVNVGLYLAELRETLKWGDGRLIREELDRQIEQRLGPKTEADTAPLPKQKKEAKPKKEEAAAKAPVAAEKAAQEAEAPAAAPALTSSELHFPDPKDNDLNKEEILKKHLAATGGIVITRFPPEPNGYLHIGHAKAMSLDFGFAVKKGGKCILRYDDTNPEAEKMEYIESIQEDVAWLGHKPSEITYSSDYFQELYEFAVQLIKKDLAYVCHQTREEISKSRELMTDSPWRNRPIEESLRIFEDMRKGKVGEGEATLRLKMNMQHENSTMRDLIAYRVKFLPHPHAGDKWCIYPSYDFTHCVVDSIENVTHSLCTLEFEVRREPYYWLLDAIEIFKPIVWEYARLNITRTVMSKRRLTRLVREGYVRGWDDPRMPTICGLRRRGYTPESINHFCELVGVTRNANVISHKVLEHCVRQDLDKRCERRFAVIDPLRVVITNYEGEGEYVSAPKFPRDPSLGSRQIPFGAVIYIEKSDFRTVDSRDYYGLAPGKEVNLKYAYNMTCNEVITNAKGEPTELRVTYDKTNARKTKGHIHWVAEYQYPSKNTVEIRLYDELFKSETPADKEDWLQDLNPDSLAVMSNAKLEPSLFEAKVGERFQFERLGFFNIDKDTISSSGGAHYVLNRSITLKDSYSDKAKDTKA